jgi:hypothetical protein
MLEDRMSTRTETDPVSSTRTNSEPRSRPPALSGEGTRAQFFDSKLRLLPGVVVPVRSMLVDPAQDPILISPVVTRSEASAVQALNVLVSPSLLHHLSMRSAIERYRPRAVWGPPGLAKKKPELAPLRHFGVDKWPHANQLEFELVEGAPARNEVVFFHKSSRTLYTADLVFNIHDPEGLLSPLGFRAMGIYKRFGAANMWRRWVKDHAAFQRSMRRILAWDFERLVMAHGDIVDHGGRAALERAFRELKLL